MSNILARCRVGKDVICDDGDHLEPQVALYYDHDPDDPTPLFGDVGEDAMAIEMMLYEGTLDRGTYAAIERMRCNDHVVMEGARRAKEKTDLALKRSRAQTKEETASRLTADLSLKRSRAEARKEKAGRFAANEAFEKSREELRRSSEELEKSEAKLHKGSDESVRIQKERTDAFWYGNKTLLLELERKNRSYVKIFQERIKPSGTWPPHNPQVGYAPDATTIRKWVKKFLEEDSS